MKEEYDFSNAERGRFYHPDTQINYPAASEQGIKRAITGVLRATSHIVVLSFSHTFQSCLHYRVFRQYLQNNHQSKTHHPITFFLLEDIV